MMPRFGACKVVGQFGETKWMLHMEKKNSNQQEHYFPFPLSSYRRKRNFEEGN